MTSSDIPKVRERVATILGWPTDTVAVDFCDYSLQENGDPEPECPHTILVFVPGNPGCIGWYIPNLLELVTRLGHGFAARGVSYAGHSPDDEPLTNVEKSVPKENHNGDASILFTVDGQIRHKCAFMDHVLSEYKLLGGGQSDATLRSGQAQQLPRFIFLSHSIGAHMVERLCVLRQDILHRTVGIIHLMPFTRMKAPPSQQYQLDTVAARPELVIAVGKVIMHVLQCLPKQLLDNLAKSTFEDDIGRDLAVRLLRQPTYAKRFFELGTEEIRDVPQNVDTSALRIIGKHCPIAMLYCGNDHWAPEFHQGDIKDLQQKNIIPQNISLTFLPELRHDYVSNDQMVTKAVDWCFESIQAALAPATNPRSRL